MEKPGKLNSASRSLLLRFLQHIRMESRTFARCGRIDEMTGYILATGGLLASAVGVYVAASFALAQKHLLAATRLHAYLMHWKRWAIDAETYGLFEMGQMWDEEEQAVFRRGWVTRMNY